MKSICVMPGTGGELQYRERPMPKVRGMNILVQIHASSMNPHDWKYYATLLRLYRYALPLPPLLLGHDLAGTVVEVGPWVRRFQVGDAVYAMSAKTGAFGEYLSLDARMVAPKPAGLSYIEAATLPMAALTALQALKIAHLKAGDHVLINGGSGGVGSLAIQIAKARGAVVTAVCSTRNLDLVRRLGADHTMDYTQIKPSDAAATFDIIFDTIGSENVQACTRILQPGGQFISTGSRPDLLWQSFGSRLISIFRPRAPIVTTFLAMPLGRHLEEIRQLVESGAVKPVLDRTFALTQIGAAMDYSKQGRTRGKIALQVMSADGPCAGAEALRTVS